MDEDYDLGIKIIIIGDVSVGKTSLLYSYLNRDIGGDTKATIGAEYHSHFVQKDDQKIKIMFWDTSGQERFQAITDQYYKGSQGVIVVYDISKKTSFEKMKKFFVKVEEQLEDYNTLILGNKKDLMGQREVPFEEAKEYADEKQAIFRESSALKEFSEDLKDSIDLFINQVSDAVIQREQLEYQRQKQSLKGSILKIQEPIEVKKNCCQFNYVKKTLKTYRFIQFLERSNRIASNTWIESQTTQSQEQKKIF